MKLRIGKDFVSSTVVLLAKLKLFTGRSFDRRLHHAYRAYMKWCADHHKNTSIHNFSKRDFKMASILGCDGVCASWILFGTECLVDLVVIQCIYCIDLCYSLA